MLDILAKNHKIWVRMALSFGCDMDEAQDLVQEFYLRMHKYIKDPAKIMYNDDEVNRFFVYVTLKNMYKSYRVAQAKYKFFDIWEEEGVEDFKEEVFDHNMDAAFERLINKIESEMDGWHRYDKILSEKYLKTDYSLREIADGTGISLTSIFNSMRANKKILKEKFSEDYQDFKNGDYNLI